MSKLTIKLLDGEYNALLKDLVDLALELKGDDTRTLIRIVQLLLYGEWENDITE